MFAGPNGMTDAFWHQNEKWKRDINPKSLINFFLRIYDDNYIGEIGEINLIYSSSN